MKSYMIDLFDCSEHFNMVQVAMDPEPSLKTHVFTYYPVGSGAYPGKTGIKPRTQSTQAIMYIL